MGQGFPGGVVGHLLGGQERGQGSRGRLGLAEGRGHQQDRTVGVAGERRDEKRTRRVRDHQVERGQASGASVGNRSGDTRIGGEQVDEAGQDHRETLPAARDGGRPGQLLKRFWAVSRPSAISASTASAARETSTARSSARADGNGLST